MSRPIRQARSPEAQAAATDERLRPYVTGLAVEWLRSTPQARHQRIVGSLAFVDISGFTTLTERLAAKGKAGAEEMSDLLNGSFATLLARAYAYGASLVKWGGDAVLLLFEGPEHALLACHAADEMQRTMRRIGRLRTSVGIVQLRMSVGIHSGAFDFFLVGTRHHELLVAGPAATATAAMEQIAEAGEVVVSPQTAVLLPQRCVGAAKEAGFLLRSAPPVDPRSRWWGPSSGVDVGAFLDQPLREHLVVEVGESEHRQVAVGFVEVSGVDDLLAQQGPGAVAHALHELLASVQAVCEHHRVTFWETDISKDGFKIMLIAGAPRSSGHDEDGMLRATRALLDGYDGPVRLRVGLNCGRVFNGGFGPAFRRTWSVKGDAINLAARVMGKAAAGQLLATDLLLQRVSSRVDAEPLAPFLVKGKKHPVQAAAVRAVTTERVAEGAHGSFVGRVEELQQLVDAARDAGRGQGRAIAVTGDAGIGKSRLVDQLCSQLDASTAVLRSFGDAYESSTPYYAVRRLLRAAVGLAPDTTEDVVAATLRRLITAARPALADHLPMVAVPFGLRLPDTAATAAVQDEFRRTRTVSLVVELLQSVVTGPTVFVVDDGHAVDDASAELLARLAAEATSRAWLLLVLGRDLPAAMADSLITRMPLAGLPAHDARELVVRSPDGEQLAPHAIRAIVERGEGNPLFLQELTVTTRGLREPGDLPSSLEELLAAQVDDLAPLPRRLLRTVSVLGTRFDPVLADRLVDGSASAAQWAELSHFLATHQDGTRRFRSGLVRDAAYEGLPFRRRVELHGRAAAVLRERMESGDQDCVEALSLHSFAANRYADAWRYSLDAGRRAQQVYANLEALTFYARARTVARRLPDLDTADLASLLESIGDVNACLAELEPAMEAYRAARRTAPPETPLLRARVALSAALVAERAGEMARATRWMSISRREAADGGAGSDRSLLELEARVTVERAFLMHTVGKAGDAATLSQQALSQAESVTAVHVVARSLLLLDLIDLAAGRAGDEARVERALALFEQCGDLRRQAGTWNHLGMRAYFRGDWDTAVERYARAQAAHEQSGDEWSASIASANIGEILVDQGNLLEAEPRVVEALRVWRASGTPSDIGFGAALLGRLRARRGRWAEAFALYAESVAAYATKAERFAIVDVDLRVAEALLLQGAAEAASAHLDVTEERLREALRVAGVVVMGDGDADLPPAPLSLVLWRLRGYAAGQLGARDLAEQHFRRSLEAARGRGARHEIALSLSALTWLGASEYAPEAAALLASLGIGWSPEMPRRGRVEPDQAHGIVLPDQRTPAAAGAPATAESRT